MEEHPGKRIDGKLKIGDHWNAITIIALSQTNPLKAIAEFVENSIDAKAKDIVIIRGKAGGMQYLKVIDDGQGIDDFRYVATHIGDSIKRQLKRNGEQGIQGEFGIGLLSFWTVGDECSITSTDANGVTRRMTMVKGNPGYSVREVPTLFARTGTELNIRPILPGVKMLSGEKIQNYLASELRDRISRSGVRIKVVDRGAKKELVVEPRKFHGRLLHGLPDVRCPYGDVYVELYISEPSENNSVGIHKAGTRVMPNITSMERFSGPPWTSRYLEGIVDAPFLQITPGTRDGFVYDDAFESFSASMEAVEGAISERIKEQEKAAEEEASKAMLHRVTKALREAFLLLPQEEYGWLGAKTRVRDPNSPQESGRGAGGKGAASSEGQAGNADGDLPGGDSQASWNENEAEYGSAESQGASEARQKEFFEYSGPLFRLAVSPSSCVVRVGDRRKLRAIARDKSKRYIDSGIKFEWRIKEGNGNLVGIDGEFADFYAPEDPGLIICTVSATQAEIELEAEAVITVVADLVPRKDGGGSSLRKGLPGYTFRKAPGELWRSKYEDEKAIIVINNSHADFIYASKSPGLKLKYITKLFAKELVLFNFPEASREELLERIVELSLYVEENLK